MLHSIPIIRYYGFRTSYILDMKYLTFQVHLCTINLTVIGLRNQILTAYYPDIVKICRSYNRKLATAQRDEFLGVVLTKAPNWIEQHNPDKSKMTSWLWQKISYTYSDFMSDYYKNLCDEYDEKMTEVNYKDSIYNEALNIAYSLGSIEGRWLELWYSGMPSKDITSSLELTPAGFSQIRKRVIRKIRREFAAV